MDYFDEKSRQLDIGGLTAFGIRLSSRHARASEMIEMIAFAQLAALQSANHLVSEVYYDSNSQCCYFTLSPDVNPHGDDGERIKSCALRSISQFDWDGMAEHGKSAFRK